MKKTKKVFTAIYYMLTIAFFAWLAVSYLEIVLNNMNPDYIYSERNAFILLLKLRELFNC